MEHRFQMIDISGKVESKRKAIAVGSIRLGEKTLSMVRERSSPKGDILAMAEVAGVLGAKNASSLLPLCHPLLLDAIQVNFEIQSDQVKVFCEVRCTGKTGVEMEALAGVNAALLTIYDLAKAVDPVIEITNIYLQKKEGGKSGVWVHPREPQSAQQIQKQEYSFAVITLSDRASLGVYEDKSGPLLRDYFSACLTTELEYRILPDDGDSLRSAIENLVEKRCSLIALTGGTGIGPRDRTPDILKSLSAKELPGFGEAQRIFGAQFTRSAWLSRASAFVVGQSLVVLFPGSPKAVQQGLHAIGELIPHALGTLKGDGHD